MFSDGKCGDIPSHQMATEWFHFSLVDKKKLVCHYTLIGKRLLDELRLTKGNTYTVRPLENHAN